MKIHLVDGTYELFRSHFGAPPKKAPNGQEVGATLGMVRSLLMMLTSPGVTHVAVAFDHVIESFRNDLYSGYKTGEGVDPELLAQFPLAEEAVSALGVVVWSMVEFEADDAIATATARFKKNKSVEQVVICSVDKDLTQMVEGQRVVCWDRRREIILDEKGVIEKFGVHPESIPDYLALVGDSADGFPGITGCGPRTAAGLINRYGPIEKFPKDVLRNSGEVNNRDLALLFKDLATLRVDAPLFDNVDELRWQGPTPAFKKVAEKIGEERLVARLTKLQKRKQ